MGMQRDGAVLRSLELLFKEGVLEGLSDAQLLERFRTRRDEPSFAAIVDRYGSMVLRVCRRVLGDPHDAQDAFQATFLVLVRRAPSLRVKDSVGPWLYGVAVRVALCARTTANRRRRFEQRVAELSGLHAAESDTDDLGPVLHQEINRLPERYRKPIVLFHLAGLSHDQVAEQLGCPVGTVRSRLVRGRERLRERLTRRGLAPTSVASTVLLAAAPCAVPDALAAATSHAAVRFATGQATLAGTVSASVATLTEGVLKVMFLNKLKWGAAGLLVFATATAGVSVLAQSSSAEHKDQALASASDDRIGKLEAKLDRLIQALEASGRVPHPSATPVVPASPSTDAIQTSAAIVAAPGVVPSVDTASFVAPAAPVPGVAAAPPIAGRVGPPSALDSVQPAPIPGSTGARVATPGPATSRSPSVSVSSETVPAAVPLPPGSSRSDARRLEDVERRLDALEQKLDRLIERLDRPAPTTHFDSPTSSSY